MWITMDEIWQTTEHDDNWCIWPQWVGWSNCNLEVNVEEAEWYHQNESIQARQSYSFTSHLSSLPLLTTHNELDRARRWCGCGSGSKGCIQIDVWWWRWLGDWWGMSGSTKNNDSWFQDDHPPLDSFVPDIQLERQEEVQDDYLSRTYSRKRFRTQLEALIPTTSKKRRIFPSPPTLQHYHPSTLPLPPLPSYTTYEPYNPLSYLARLRTFHPCLYFPFLPHSISPIVLAGNGWFCSSRDGVECRCGAKFGVGGLVDIKDPRVREEIGRRLGQGKVDRHMAGCGWRILSCPGTSSSFLLPFATIGERADYKMIWWLNYAIHFIPLSLVISHPWPLHSLHSIIYPSQLACRRNKYRTSLSHCHVFPTPMRDRQN